MKTVFTKSRVASALLLATSIAFGIETPKISPVFFQENKGQICDQNFRPRPDVLFSGSSKELTYHLTQNGISYQISRVDEWKEVEVKKTHAKVNVPEASSIYRVDINWLNSNQHSKVSLGETVNGLDNYYMPHCPNGVLNVRSFNSIKYENIYPGIDLKWYEKNGELEYDFIVSPNANPYEIKFEIKGETGLKINKKGELEIKTPMGIIIEKAPVAFQNGKQISTKWVLDGTTISFEIGSYNKNIELVIDPIVRMFGTNYGGGGTDYITGISTDVSGNVYSVGYSTTSTGTIIATSGSHLSIFAGGLTDGFLAKFNSAGVRQFATYYGGVNDDNFTSCDLDASSNIYISGYTNSSTGISTGSSHQLNRGGLIDAMLIKFNSVGVRQWATYYGGSQDDYGFNCSVDASSNVYLVGQTTTPTGTIISTAGSHQSLYGGGVSDGFLVKFNSAGVRQWGTYYGGVTEDIGADCKEDGSGNIYITGTSNSTGNLLATPGAFQIVVAGNRDAFLAKFNSAGVRQWGTYYGGGASDYGNSCTTDISGNVYFAGTIGSNATGLVTAGCHQPVYNAGGSDGFLAKFNSTGTRQWATFYGGVNADNPTETITDATGNVYMCGNTLSSNAIGTGGSHQPVYGGGTVEDGFMVKFDVAGVRQFGTYYGSSATDYAYSIAVDVSNAVYLVGATGTSTGTAIATSLTHQSAYGGGTLDGYIAKFYQCANITPTITGSSTVCSTGTTTLSATGASLTTYTWSTGSNSSSVVVTPTGTTIYTLTAGTATSYCSYSDTHTISILPTPTITSTSNGTLCAGNPYNLICTVAGSVFSTGFLWNNGINTYNNQGVLGMTAFASTIYTLTVTNPGPCLSIATTTLTVLTPTLVVNNATTCAGSQAILNVTGATTYSWNTSATTSSIVVTPTNTTVYTVTGYNGSCSASKTSTVSVNALPSLTLTSTFNAICTSATGGNTIALSGTPAGGVYSGVSVTGATFNAPTTAGTYTATYTYTNSTTTCTNSATKTITVSVCTGLEELSLNGKINIYPNPNNGEFTLIVPEEGIYMIVNSIGQTVEMIDVKENSQTISIQGLADGIYYVVGKSAKSKIVVSK